MTININSTTFSLLLLVVLFSCSAKKRSGIIEFEIFSENANEPYLILQQNVNDSSGYRKITSKYFDRNMNLVNIEKDVFFIEKGNVYKKNKSRFDLYLTTNTDSCVFWGHHDQILFEMASTNCCFIGVVHEFDVNEKKYSRVFKFKEITGIGEHQVISYIFFDKNFYLIEEEFSEGYSSYFRIERR